MENNTLCNRHSLGVNNHTKMYVTYTRIYGWSDYGGESSYQPGYRLENMMWMTLLVYDYIIPGDNLVSVKSLEDALLLAKGRDVYISGGYGLFKEALQIVDKMYITEVDLNIEDGDTFFPEFDINDFEVLIGETLGEEVKYTRTFYVRKNELSRFWI